MHFLMQGRLLPLHSAAVVFVNRSCQEGPKQFWPETAKAQYWWLATDGRQRRSEDAQAVFC